MTVSSVVARVVRAMLRRLRAIRLALASAYPAPTQNVSRKRANAAVTTHRLLQAEVYAATGRLLPIRRFS